MKIERKLKIVFVVLLIILISLISFGGIFIQNAKFVENIIPNYQLGMDLTGSRVIGLGVSTSVNKVIYDKDGKVVQEEAEGTTTKEEPVNKQEDLTKENYQKSKETFEARLKEMKVENYTMRFDENSGKAIVQLPENANTDMIAQYTAIKGVFQVVNEEKEVLLTNEHIKKAQVAYGSTEAGTTVYLTIQFNKEGTQILKDITNTYVKTVDEEGKEQSKTVTFKIDDSTLINTYFSQEISNGTIQLSLGQATTSNEDLTSYIKEASNLAVLLNTNALPLTYTIEENRYVMSDITEDMFYVPAIVVISLIVIAIIALMIAYRKNGLLAAISFVGYIAIFLLVLRYTNVMLTLEGMVGILIAIMLNYIFSIYLLHLLKHQTEEDKSIGFKQAILKTIFILVPVAITAVVLCFAGWLPIYSFGMVIFWGIVTGIIYHLIFTRTLIVSSTDKK